MLSRLLLLLPIALSTYASPLPQQTPTPTPAPTATAPASASTLAPRCENGDCTYGGTATTLQAATVTTTILTTTSVPCYVTTYVVSSQTVSSTVYSTQTVTSTVTSEGTIYVYQNSPTPVLYSSTYESVLQVTETLTTFWQSVQGTAYASTVTGAYNTSHGGGNAPAQPTSSANAWTHAVSGVQADYAGGGGTAVATPADGWVTAGGANGVAVTGSNGVAVGQGGAVVNWNAGARLSADVNTVLILALGITFVLLFDIVWNSV